MSGLKHPLHETRTHRKRAATGDPDRGLARALVELSQAISKDWDASIRRILELDARLLHVDRANFWRMCGLTGSIHCDAGYISSLHSFEHGATLFESDVPEYFAALRTTRVVDMHDVRTDPRCRGLREYCASRGVASMLDVSASVDGRLWGVLCHEHIGTPRHWTQRDRELATSMGQVVAPALLASAQTRAEATARRAAFLDAVVRGLASLDPRREPSHARTKATAKTCRALTHHGGRRTFVTADEPSSLRSSSVLSASACSDRFDGPWGA